MRNIIIVCSFIIAAFPLLTTASSAHHRSTGDAFMRVASDAGTLEQGGDKHAKPLVTVYYFHTSRRCKTCLSIERIARGVVKDQYGDDDRVAFRSLNIEEEKNEALVERYEVAGSALLVCRGKKKDDLTTRAFQYALSSPDKLQHALLASIK